METITSGINFKVAHIQEIYVYAYKILEEMISPSYEEAQGVLKSKLRILGGAPALDDPDILAAANFLGFAIRIMTK
jgi:hypothetical protein